MSKVQKSFPVKFLNRRNFFKAAGISAVSGTVALVVDEKSTEAGTIEPHDTPTPSRYRETAHVRQAYKLARF